MSDNTEHTDSYTNQVIDTFSQWSNQVSVQEGIIFLLVKGEHQPITLVAMGDEQSKLVTVFARFSEFCPQELYVQLAQKLNAINFQVNIGCWSVDEEDGEIRYRITQYFSNLPTVKELQMITSYIVAGIDSLTQELQDFLSENNEL
jgi:hypothetical protein